MDSAIVHDAARATLDGTLPFPEIVGMLIGTGVESYHVDYAGLRKTFYGTEGAQIVTPIPCEGLPPIAAEFDSAAVKSAILDSQRNGQKWRDFSRRVMAAGVQGYIAFLRGKRVTYFGRTGDQHTERFPGAGPTSSP